MRARSRLVPEVLEQYGAATRAILFRYLPDVEPRRYLYDLVADYPRRGGRALRPSLCIATARAFGGRIDDAVATAASIELLHNALLVHDDIEDESQKRRGKPTMHEMWGVPMAINVGDTLTLLSLRPLLDNRRILGPRLAMRILEETERTARESAEGQALELGWRHDNIVHVRESDYLEMVLKKTCWLTTIHPSRVGALIGTSGGVDLEPFVRFGFLMGCAFQIQDDVLNLIGDEAAYGKELDGDIHEGKRTLMMIRLMERAQEDERRRVVEMLALPRSERTADHVRWVRSRMDAYGCIEYAQEVASGLAGAALAEFDVTYGHLPPSRDKDFIEELITWVIERT
ncbi:polyprenyl synthetase family protein [Polyangium aurulentum]|uniref:polyprenyl synthetase family protein n=1 Tax=Polyangium aurulentum TaxID=2567896 RepID=UPI0010AE87FE|nr:polyprenyl synthetase family protein [Polyangium aurulentum]UQA60374.1 polyprenyl synthetase family protein [Polyangium aurulentum]